MILRKSAPGGSPERRIGGFVLAAIDAEIILAEGCVHEIAMMRIGRIGMGEGAEIAAADAHALDGNVAVFLQLPDHGDKREQHLLLHVRFKGIGGTLGGAGPAPFDLHQVETGGGAENAHGAQISGVGALLDKPFALKRYDGIRRRGLRHQQVGGDLLDAHSFGAAFEQGEYGELGWIYSCRARTLPIVGTHRHGDTLEAFMDAKCDGSG